MCVIIVDFIINDFFLKYVDVFVIDFCLFNVYKNLVIIWLELVISMCISILFVEILKFVMVIEDLYCNDRKIFL